METNILFPSIAHIVNILAGIMLVSSLLVLTQKGMHACINLFIIHSFFLSLVMAVVAFGMHEPHLYIGFLLMLMLKVGLIPGMLFWLIKEIKVNREVQFYINTSSSLLIAGALTVFSFYITHRVFPTGAPFSQAALTMALAMMLIGFFIMISRTKALTQMLGFLFMENSLFFLASITTFGIPFFIEVSISFDVLVALLIMGIFLFKINQTFHHINVSQLQENKE